MKSGWTIKKLGEVCELVGGGTPSIHESSYYGGDIPWATVRDMNCRVIEKTERTITQKGLENSASNVIPAGNVVISTHVGLGKVCFVAQDTAINQDLKGVIPFSDNVEKVFLYYWFLSIAEYLEKSGTGSTVRGVKLDFVKSLDFPVPLLSEQKRIVAKIDAAFEKINKLKANAERNLANAKELFQSALDEAMRPKKGWVEKRLGEVGKATTGITPSMRNKENFGEYIPFVKPGDITPFEPIAFRKEGLSQKGVEESRLIIRGSTLMVCIGASIGKTGYANKDCTCNQQINALTPGDLVDGRFLYYLLSSEKFKSKVIAEAGQATLPIISKSKWECLAISMPTVIAEQLQIVKRLDFLAEKIKLLEQNYTRQIVDCAELRQSVLREAFEGRL